MVQHSILGMLTPGKAKLQAPLIYKLPAVAIDVEVGYYIPMLTPDDLQRYIEEHRIAAHLLRDVGETSTVVDAARALAVPPEHIIKTLIFLVDGRPVVYITNGPERVDPRVLARHFGVGRKKVKFADAETVLRLTGYPVGGVPPFGHKTPLPVLIDARVLTLPAVYGGGGDERTMLRTTPEELLRVTRATVVGGEKRA